MEIGRKAICDEEFANLWSTLYQEFITLSNTDKCDASVVYDTIYMICTSESNLEEKLYWKIGDFFYNRCKIHKDQIIIAPDYLQEYVKNFQEYCRLVDSVHSLGSFLNSCVKGRKLNDFGYLLWERMVINNMPVGFFENVFEYTGDNRLVILDCFKKIVPDAKQPMLFYNERYERIALQKIRLKYSVKNITNLEEFYRGIKTIVDFENHSMMSTFLTNSYVAVHKTLEDCFFGVKYYEIVYNLIEFINVKNFANIKKKTGKGESFVHHQQKNINQSQVHFEGKDAYLDSQSVFSYEKIPDSQIENLKTFLESDLNDQKSLVSVQNLINKERYSEINPSDAYKADQENLFTQLLNCFGSLNAGYTLLKKAYALYINSVIKDYITTLDSTIEDVVALFFALNIFEDEDCLCILFSIFKDYLQRSKPCYMQRLCDYTMYLTRDLNDKALINQKPFFRENTILFKSAVNLVSDIKEFLNMYQGTLRDRLLSKESIIAKEVRLLRILDVPDEDKLFKMINEIDVGESSFKSLNGLYWNIEPQHSNIPLPIELLREMSHKRPEMRVFDKEGRNFNLCHYNYPRNEVFNLKIRLNTTGTESKVMNLAHQYTKIRLCINTKNIVFNIYQYVIISMLMKSILSFADINKKLDIPEKAVMNALESLITSRFITYRAGVYSLDCTNIQDGDYSKIIKNTEPEKDICIESYLQTLGAKILKTRKNVDANFLINEIKMLSRVDTTTERIESSIKKLIEKGFAELKGNRVDFIS